MKHPTLRKEIIAVSACLFFFTGAVGPSAHAQSSSASVPLCHAPAPRTPTPQTLFLPEAAAIRHEGHGDHPGVCSPPPDFCTATTIDARANLLLPELYRFLGELQEAQWLELRFGSDPVFDEEDNPPLLAAMASCIQQELSAAPLVGFAWSLSRGDQVLEQAGGWARAPWETLNPGVPMTPNTRLPIASVSKAISAAAIMKLLDKYGIDLDASLIHTARERFTSSDLIENPGNPVVWAGVTAEWRVERSEAVTFRHLLTHYSGFQMTACNETEMTRQLINGPAKPPGSVGYYNGMNYCILEKFAEAMEPRTLLVPPQERFERFMAQTIFEPTGTSDVICLHNISDPGPDLTLLYNAVSPVIQGPGLALVEPNNFGACSQGGLLLSARELRLFLDWVDDQASAPYDDPAFLIAWLGECTPPDGNGFQRCPGLVAKPTVAGKYYTHGGSLDCCGWRGVGSWIMSFPFAVNAALVVNTKPSLADNPETEEIDPKCPCANDDEASNSGSTCPSIPFCPNLPIRDGEEIVVKCFEEAVRLENFVDPNPD